MTIDPEYGEQLPLDPSLVPLDAAINEALDFRDEVARVLANKDDAPPAPTDDDDHGDDDDEGDDDGDFDGIFKEDLVITVPHQALGRSKIRLVLEIDKR